MKYETPEMEIILFTEDEIRADDDFEASEHEF